MPNGINTQAAQVIGSMPHRHETKKTVSRGLTNTVATHALQQRVWLRSLSMLARMRVMRTLDVAVHCFAERAFKASLSAAQRAVRGMVKAKLLRRYRTDRFQTVYGLTARGAGWLADQGVDAAASVRRVSDMSNPEHRLWSQFLVLCCEARGLRAMTEGELLVALNVGRTTELVSSLLNVHVSTGSHTEVRGLRPDLVATDRDGRCVWFEVDRSKRSAGREAALRALVCAMGARLSNGQGLGRIAVFTRNTRMEKRATAVLENLAAEQAEHVLTEGRRRVVAGPTPGLYEVWAGVLGTSQDGRRAVEDRLVGRVSIQALPTWLPKVRIDASNQHSTAGWFSDNALPYALAPSEPPWTGMRSPLL